jgi:hypothetical protein
MINLVNQVHVAWTGGAIVHGGPRAGRG